MPKRTALPPFHLAFAVHDLSAARQFYGELLGCPEGRSDKLWVDFNLFGHQIVAHLTASGNAPKPTNPVDGEEVPVPHFGVVLGMEDWQALADSLTGRVDFVIEPYLRFEGQPGEQATMFFLDPSGNALEFKGFRDLEQLFAT